MRDHGSAVFTWKDSILYFEAYGPFNEEGVVAVATEYQEHVMNPPCKPFSVIEIWDELTLTSPAGFDEIAKFWASLEGHGCESFALVLESTIQRGIVSPILPKHGIVVSTLQEAEDWVQSNRA